MSRPRFSRPYKMELTAGVPQTVRQQSEYWFCEQGRDLVVRTDGVIHDGVKAGDKDKPDAPFQEFQVTSPVDQVVVFRIGWGEWSRLIVSGELNVSAYVETSARGVAASLPGEVEREVGAVSLGETQYTQGTVEYAHDSAVDANQANNAAWFDGEFISVTDDGRVVGFDHTTPDDTYNWTDTGSNSPWESFRPPIGVTVADDGFIYCTNVDHIFRRHMGDTGYWTKLEDLFFDSVGGDPGLHFYNGKLWACENNDWIVSYNLATGEKVYELHRNNVDGVGFQRVCGHGKYIYISGLAGFEWRAIDLSGSSPAYVQSENVIAGGITYTNAFDPYALYAAAYSSGAQTVFHGRTVKTFGTLYQQKPGVVESRIEWPIYSRAKYFRRAGGQVIVRDWVGEVLAELGGGEYLDYLTGYAFDNGYAEIQVNSGTQTFQRRGMAVPELAVLDGSTLKLQLLPEYFE